VFVRQRLQARGFRARVLTPALREPEEHLLVLVEDAGRGRQLRRGTEAVRSPGIDAAAVQGHAQGVRPAG
jgi:hypothetical protein